MKNEYCICCGGLLEGRLLKYCSKECAKIYRNKDFGNTRKPPSKEYLKSREAQAMLLRLELVESLGGKCSKCGYDRNIAALHFHHLRDKSFPLDATNILHRKLEDILNEVKKCELLCSNCHIETHRPLHSKDVLRDIANSHIQKYEVYKDSRKPKKKVNLCKDCGVEISRQAIRCQTCATRHKVKYKPFTNVSNSEEQ